jgi:hypothetical protein
MNPAGLLYLVFIISILVLILVESPLKVGQAKAGVWYE